MQEAAAGNLADSVAAERQRIGRVLQLDSDIGRWEYATRSYPSTTQLKDARKHLGLAVFAMTSGLYGQAFGSLRVFLELSFASVYFSTDELHRRQWLADRRDFSWSGALDAENGILSRKFVQEFHPMAVNEAKIYAEKASTVYRECSEFVHGKLSRSQRLPEKLAFSADLVADWSEAASSAAESVLFLLFCRFADDLLPDSEHASDLGETLEHSLGHLVAVRTVLGLPVEAR